MKKAGLRLLLITVVCVLLVLNYKYYPVVIPAPGYSLLVPTQPNLVTGFWKRLAADFEFGRVCRYSILGWSTENELYVESTCLRYPRVWSYNPEQASISYVQKIPNNLKAVDQPVIEYIRVRDWNAPASNQPLRVGPDDIKFGTSEKDYRSTVTEQDGIISPNKRWLVFVGRHLYGPEDVIILGTSTSFQVDE